MIQYSLRDCYILRFFFDCLQITQIYIKNTTKPENIPGLLHFFGIFCNSPLVSTVSDLY